ncbi:DAK2 domain-containing protein [Angustibacter sp. McL0619]|uniref:DAK2 domain-containing protein n=1 Tax=Angustibacter sp. McL0619 TaxID=3415676 RepID=UPI003CEA6C55
MLDHLDARAARRWGIAALEHLGDQRDEIDGLNVYPVPDGDTGTNLYLTVEAAVAAVEQLPDGADLAAVADGFARGALLGAHGNSGVILSQLLRGWADVLGEQPDGGGAAVRAALGRATEQAYAAVGRPVEGTMLSVARAASSAAGECVDAPLGRTLEHAVTAAREALARTPEQLEALARAGVVDAGGKGVVILLEALANTVSGRRSVRRRARPAGGPSAAQSCGDLAPGGPSYEVMYLLDAVDGQVPGLRTALDGLGDSLVVVGGGGLWNVHVHTDDVGAAVEAGIVAGRPYRIRVTHFADQRERWARANGAAGSGVAVVAAAAGPGLERLFAACGAVVVRSASGRRASTGELLDAVRATGAASVVLLPNDPDTLVSARAAATAARDEGLQVAVLPSRAAVQGLAAIAVHDAAGSASEDLVRMAAAAAATRHGAVTLASRDALTSSGWCRVGDALGMVEGDVVVVGDDLRQVSRTVVARMLAAGGELLTVVTGADPVSQALAEAVLDEVRDTRRDVEVSVVDGGQEGYPLLLGLE